MQLAIVPAAAPSLDEINAVIAVAKRSLGYEGRYVEAALPLMRVDERYLASNWSFEARVADRIVGFAAVEPMEEGVVLLDHLWIVPGLQRRGIGRQLVSTCVGAVAGIATVMRLYADPPSESFYLKLGASRVGERPSRVPGGPVFPVLEFVLSTVPAAVPTPPSP